MTKHARISASKIERAYLCPKSVVMEEEYPDTTNEAAERGTAIHALAEGLLLGTGTPYSADSYDDEMIQFATDYYEFIKELSVLGETHIEVNLTPALSKIHPDFGGTADAVIIGSDKLIVIDLKTGRVPVTAKNNKQLMTYALGAYIQFANKNPIKQVEMIIYQGPLGVSHEIININDILEWDKTMRLIAREANDPFAETNPGNKQCKYCKAKQSCPALRQIANDVAREDFQQAAAQADMANKLEIAEIVELWAEAVKKEAKEILSDDGKIPGWEMSSGRKMIKFANKTASEAYLAGNPLAFTIKTPAELKKLGIQLPEDHLIEERSAPSLVRIKQDLV